jgi:hypothetical protein
MGLQGGTPKAISLLTSDSARAEPGQEVTISYGADKSNEELLHLYGKPPPTFRGDRTAKNILNEVHNSSVGL